MRFFRNIVIILITIVAFGACKKETTENVSKEVKVSFPTITLNGASLVVVPVGGTYTDAGAKLTDDVSGQTTEIQPTSGSVNTAQPGLYVLNYSAANANGFEASASRLVAVTSVNNLVDYSGTYLRPATGVKAFVTRVAPGVYKVQNPGGAAVGVDVIIYFVETSPNVFVAPPQPTVAGPFGASNITFTATGASWAVQNVGYGTALRTFIKE